MAGIMNIKLRGNGFVVLDESIASTGKDSRRFCRNLCDRNVRQGLSRGLQAYEWCCVHCDQSKGLEHTDECSRDFQLRLLPATSKAVLAQRSPVHYDAGVDDVCLRLSSDALNYNSDLDIDTARAILDTAAKMNGLPSFDTRRITRLFSKFSITSTIRYPDSREFLYRAFKKMHRHVRIGPVDLGIHRFFFVLQDSKVREKYRFRSLIGRGSFGVVHRVVHIASAQERVCKSVGRQTCSLPVNQLEAEIRIVAQLDHPNVVRIFEYFQDETEVHLIQEFCNGGDLLSRIKQSIKQQRPLQHDFIIHVIRETLSSVAFMANNGVIHKDLKPENIMFVERGTRNGGSPTVKVIDFGLSEIFGRGEFSSTTVAGTAFYMAPEIFRPPFTGKCDIWACGVMAFFMLTGFLPFFGSTVEEVQSYVLYRRLQWPTNFAGGELVLSIPCEAKDFVEKLLEKDPKLRYSAMDAISHPWLARSRNDNATKFSLAIVRNIYDFSLLSIVRRAMINLVAHLWEFVELEDIRQLFVELDKNHLGYLTVPSLAGTFENAGLSPFNAWKSAKSLDISNTGRITFTALTAGVAYPLIDSSKRILKTVFDAFSPNEKGNISIREMWRVLTGHRCAIPRNEASLSFEDFRDIVLRELRHATPGKRNTKSSLSHFHLLTNPMEHEFNLDDFRRWLLSPVH